MASLRVFRVMGVRRGGNNYLLGLCRECFSSGNWLSVLKITMQQREDAASHTSKVCLTPGFSRQHLSSPKATSQSSLALSPMASMQGLHGTTRGSCTPAHLCRRSLHTQQEVSQTKCESSSSTPAWFWGGSGGRPDVGSPALTPNKVRLCLVCIEGKMREKKPLQNEIPYMTAC